MLRLLLSHAGNVNLKTQCNGDTPLHLAASRGKTSCVRICLEHGANFRIKNFLGYEAKDVVKKRPIFFRVFTKPDSQWYLEKMGIYYIIHIHTHTYIYIYIIYIYIYI